MLKNFWYKAAFLILLLTLTLLVEKLCGESNKEN
ncbi:MAG: hypothetical protein CMIDDMOC_00180 [Sodalis sp. Fle]|nr:MAG: hypothetical protein CMIDDMOC_00180 [Sodalis sp. Fle]